MSRDIFLNFKSQILSWQNQNDGADPNVTGFYEMATNASNTSALDDVSSGDDGTGRIAYKVASITVPILFVLIFITGIFGNGTLIYTILKNKQLRNAPNILIVSLAAGDFILIAISVPFIGTIFTLPSWPFGNFMCKLTEFFRTVSLGISVFTLTALSAERYLAIVKPMKTHRGTSNTRTLTVTACIWIVASLLAIMDAVSYEAVPNLDGNTTVYYCVAYPTEWPSWYPNFHVMFRFQIFFVIPMLIIMFCYVAMARALNRSSTHMPIEMNARNGAGANHQKQIQSRKKVATVVLSFVIIFVVCWLPRHIFLLWWYFADGAIMDLFWFIFKIFGFCMAFINSCVNPMTLYILSKQFRRHYNQTVFGCRGPKSTKGKNNGSTALYQFNTSRSSTATTMVHQI